MKASQFIELDVEANGRTQRVLFRQVTETTYRSAQAVALQDSKPVHIECTLDVKPKDAVLIDLSLDQLVRQITQATGQSIHSCFKGNLCYVRAGRNVVKGLTFFEALLSLHSKVCDE
jgi:hypothetical protein